jgi:putative endonuclease
VTILHSDPAGEQKNRVARAPTGHAVTPSVLDMASDPRSGLGALGERLAGEHLERAGYQVLERNFRCRAGELDLVAASDRALIFCEVKTRVAGGRAGPAHPLEAIGPNKRRRLRLLAREWLAAHNDERPYREALRFDAIGVTVNRAGGLLALEHVEDAF